MRAEQTLSVINALKLPLLRRFTFDALALEVDDDTSLARRVASFDANTFVENIAYLA